MGSFPDFCFMMNIPTIFGFSLFFPQGHDYPTWPGYHFTQSTELCDAAFSEAIHGESPVDFQVGERKSTAEGVMASTHSSEVLEYGTKIKN